MKSFERSIKEKILLIPQINWYLEEGKYWNDVYSLFCDRNPDDKINFIEFKSILRKLRKEIIENRDK